MKIENCTFQKASETNYDDYFKIRSEKKNMFWTGYSKAPDYNNFLKWYKTRIQDACKSLYLVYCNSECVGSLNIDYYPDRVMIGYCVKEKYEGKGFATFIVNQAVEIIKKTENKTVQAWINEKNAGSIRVVEKNNFYKTSTSEIRNRFGNDEIFWLFECKLD